MRLTRAGVIGGCVLLVWATAAAAQVEPRKSDAVDRPDPSRLIDVPYLSQTEALCGGAAAAMVMRYWGARQVYPDDFAPLVDWARGGIATDLLVADLTRRRWQTLPFSGDAAAGDSWMRRQVAQARPVIALIEVGPGRYHYVVVVAWTGDDVVVHDPARAPFQTLAHDRFTRAWAASGRWALVVLPGDDVPTTAPEPAALTPSAPAAPTPCGPFVAALVASARAGDLDGADAGLRAAAALCPSDAAVWRELAGIRFLQSRWAEAAALATRAAALDPADGPGWDLAATSHYLAGDPARALADWNRIERPLVDVVRIEGAPRTRHPVIAGTIDLPSRQLLTAGHYGRAARRLRALPSLMTAQLRYTPVDDGLADVEAAVVERPVVPRGVVPLAIVAARGALHRELRLDVAAPTGSGELWSVAWRWWEHRPRIAFSVAVPAVSHLLPGVTTVSGLWERASYAVSDASAAAVQQERRRAALGSTDWATSWLRWNAGVALDRWDDGSHASIDGGLDLRSAGDRVAVGVRAAWWAPLGTGRRFGTAGLALAVRTATQATRPRWSLLAGVDETTAAAPFDLWPGAGTGRARLPLLRAHPLLDHGVVTGPIFGPRLAHATGEYQHPVLTRPGLAIALAGFVDLARASRRLDRSPPAWHADAGLGVRVDLPGNGGTFRLDLARGLRDRRQVLSAAWVPPWPGR